MLNLYSAFLVCWCKILIYRSYTLGWIIFYKLLHYDYLFEVMDSKKVYSKELTKQSFLLVPRCRCYKEFESEGKVIPVFTGVQRVEFLKCTVADRLRFAYKHYIQSNRIVSVECTFFIHNYFYACLSVSW